MIKVAVASAWTIAAVLAFVSLTSIPAGADDPGLAPTGTSASPLQGAGPVEGDPLAGNDTLQGIGPWFDAAPLQGVQPPSPETEKPPLEPATADTIDEVNVVIPNAPYF